MIKKFFCALAASAAILGGTILVAPTTAGAATKCRTNAECQQYAYDRCVSKFVAKGYTTAQAQDRCKSTKPA
jgi:hypothetical protein